MTVTFSFPQLVVAFLMKSWNVSELTPGGRWMGSPSFLEVSVFGRFSVFADPELVTGFVPVW